MQEVLLFGGHDLENWLDTVDVFSPRQSRWRTKSRHMPFTYGYGAAAVLGSYVYLVGGGVGEQYSDKCIRYNVPREEWTPVRTSCARPHITCLNLTHDEGSMMTCHGSEQRDVLLVSQQPFS